MANKGKKSSMEKFVPNDKADYYSGITSITVNGKNAYELKGKFLDDLHNNAFSGTNGKDAVEHIEYYLKIIDPIKLPNVDHDKLRVVVFSISLVEGARRWFDRTKESITCWVDLTANFFGKAYELKGKFLDDLHNNAFSGTNGKDAVEHIEYYLKIIDPIRLPNVDHDKLRIVVFPISLAGGARRWFDRTKESITCWVDLTAKFFRKYYPPSRIEGNNTPVIKWDPANPRFEGWLATKFVNYKTMDIFTKGALWDYWKIGGDEIEVSDDESSDLEEYWSDKEETAKIFKIETDVFYYETPLCLAFNEFNYLLKVDPDLLTKDIMGFKTYEDYKDDWIYEWNENVPWVYDKPWLDNGIWKEPKPVKHTCKPFNYKTGCSEWPTCSWREDGYCNGGNLPGAYHIGNSLHYQDLEWYEALEDSELKDEALRNKAIMEGLISDDESSNDCWKRWKSHEINYHDYDEGEYENETHKEGHELCGIETREVPVCQIKRYKMIKYSFNDEEEYVAVKEDEYDDLTITSEEACRAYQEIFRMMDEGWMVTRTE
ncbi:hypothetical protein Tco_0672662 [Tanacetum coccineum]